MGVFIKEANGRVTYTDHRGERYSFSGSEDIRLDGSNPDVLIIEEDSRQVSVDQNRVSTPASADRDELIQLLSDNFFNGVGGQAPPSQNVPILSPDGNEWNIEVDNEGNPSIGDGNTDNSLLIEEDRIINKTGLLIGGRSQPNATFTGISIGDANKPTRFVFVDPTLENATVKTGWDGVFEYIPSAQSQSGFYWLSAVLNANGEFDRNEPDCWAISTLDPKQNEVTRLNNVVLAKFYWRNDGMILFAENFSNICFSSEERADILAERFSPFLLEGGEIDFANTTDATLRANAGRQFRSGANKNYYGNEKNQVPDIAPIDQDEPLRFRGRYQDAQGDWQVHSQFQDETINGDDYDTRLPLVYRNNSGNIVNVPNNRWAIYAFYRFTGTNNNTGKSETQLLLPTAIYNNRDVAWRNLLQLGVGATPVNFVDAVLTTIIIARGNFQRSTQNRHRTFSGDVLGAVGKGATSSTTLENAIQNSDLRSFASALDVTNASPAVAVGEWFLLDVTVAGLGFTTKQILQRQ